MFISLIGIAVWQQERVFRLVCMPNLRPMTFATKSHGRRGSSRASWSVWPIFIHILSPIVARRQLTRCVACCKPTVLNSDFLGEITFGWITSCNFKASIEVGKYFHQLTWINNLHYVVCAKWKNSWYVNAPGSVCQWRRPRPNVLSVIKVQCLRNRTRRSNYNNFRTIKDNLFAVRALLRADTIAECIPATKLFFYRKLVSLFHTIAPIWSRQMGQYLN